MIVLMYQNCSPGFQSAQLESLSSASTGGSTPQIPVTCTLPDGTQVGIGSVISGFPTTSAAFPTTCGTKANRTCLSSGSFDGALPVFETCAQLCIHPTSNQPVAAGSDFVYFTRASGATQAECDAARVTASCQQSTGLFSPVIPAQRFASCLVQGQTCAYTSSAGTATPSGNMTGATVTGFAMSTATFPTLCGANVTRTCQSSGQWSGAVPVYTACAQNCVHPDNNQPVSSGTAYAYYTRSTGTTAECSAARVTSSCQQATGTFSPAVGATRFATCQIQDVPARVTHEMLVGTDARYNVFKQSCVGCHSASSSQGGLNLESATLSRDKAAVILSRMKRDNSSLAPMPPSGTLQDAFKIAVVEKWVSLGAPSDTVVPPTQPPVTPPPQPPTNVNLTCEPTKAIPMVAMKRLSKTQYINSLMSLINNGGYLMYADRVNVDFAVLGSLAPLVNTIPNDDGDKFSFSSIDQTTTADHFFSYVVVSSSVADQLSKNLNWLRANSNASCLGNVATNVQPGEACVRSFIQTFGSRALRKKIETAEETQLFALFTSSASAQEGFATLLQSLLMSPRFLNIVEVDGKVSPTDPKLLELNDYELAQRLSFHFLRSVPTVAMMDAASKGLYTQSDSSYRTEALKVLQVEVNPSSPNLMKDSYQSHQASLSTLQRNYHTFFREWLDVEKMPEITESGFIDQIDALYGKNRAYGNGNVSGPIQGALKEETYNFALRMTWVENKSFYDLMTDRSIKSNGQTRSFYMLPTPAVEYSYGHAEQNLTTHSGLLTRAVVTLKDGIGDDTHAFLRGAFIRREILCDTLPAPNPDSLPDRALSSGQTIEDSKRIQYTAKTAAAECMTCHTQINPLAFALDDYDSLSRYRGGSFEPVFRQVVGANGSVTNQHIKNVPVNAMATDLNIDKPTGESVNGGIQLSEMIGNSGKANMCFTRQVFRHTMGRFESSADACMLNEMYGTMRGTGGSIKKMILEMPYSKGFRMKRIGE